MRLAFDLSYADLLEIYIEDSHSLDDYLVKLFLKKYPAHNAFYDEDDVLGRFIISFISLLKYNDSCRYKLAYNLNLIDDYVGSL